MHGVGLASEQLRSLIEPRLAPEAWRFFDGALAQRPFNVAHVLGALASSGRRAGNARVELSSAELGCLRARELSLPALSPLSLLVRLYLLLAGAQSLAPEQQLQLISRAYRTGGNDERCAVLLSLAALPEPARFVALAVDACRTHVMSVFQALACDNPYPARYFDQPSFNQLVVKALFVESPLARVEGLGERNNSELRRMVRDYADERRAAGRPVPADAKLVESSLEVDP